MSLKKELITFLDSNAYPIATSRLVWLEGVIVKVHFWKMLDENRIEVQIAFEQSSDPSAESTTLEYKAPFMDHKEGEGIH